MAQRQIPRSRTARFKVAIDESAPITRTSKPSLPAPPSATLKSIIQASKPSMRTALGEIQGNRQKETKQINLALKTSKEPHATNSGIKLQRSNSVAAATVLSQRLSQPPAATDTTSSNTLSTRGVTRISRIVKNYASARSVVHLPSDAVQVPAPTVGAKHDIPSSAPIVPPSEPEPEEEMDATDESGSEAEGPETKKMVPLEQQEYYDWVSVTPTKSAMYQAQVDRVKARFQDDVDMDEPTMVWEYADDIFAYMGRLEAEMMPSPNYMEGQVEITWDMRTTLIDWLLQVHLRYHLLPETLWIAVNIIDRFLSKRVVSLVKLQLVGVTAMYIAAKYEEIVAPSVEEFVFMTKGGYSKEDILKGERIILQTLEFRVSNYCSPYSWVRRISKADDYDLQTRTISKFLMEVTLLDYRFLRAKPSLIAAIAMYTSRQMLGGDWSDPFVFYSEYVEDQLKTGHRYIIEQLADARFVYQYVYKKYANKKFLKAAIYAVMWATKNIASLKATV